MTVKEKKFKKKLFGGTIEIIVYNPEKNLNKIINRTYKEALRLQKIFNFFDKTSELSRLNQKRKLHVSGDLFKVVKKSVEFSKLTSGRYDISLGKNFRKRKKGERLTKTQASYKDIKFNAENKEISLEHSGVILDLGSIAKGYITDKISQFMKSEGVKEFLIDSRGDILVSGKAFHLIEVQHPRKKKQTILKLKLKNQAVATSGDYMQFDKNYEKSHIINRKNLVSVTVVAPTLELADVYATAIFVSNNKQIEKLAKKNKNIKFLTVDKNMNTKFFNGMRKLIYYGSQP